MCKFCKGLKFDKYIISKQFRDGRALLKTKIDSKVNLLMYSLANCITS